MPDTKGLKGESLYFGSGFEEIQSIMEGKVWLLEQEVDGYIVPIVKK